MSINTFIMCCPYTICTILGWRKSISNKMHLFSGPHVNFLISCYRANKNKWHNSQVRFSQFIIQLQYIVYEILMKKSIQSYLPPIIMLYKNNCSHIFKMSSGLHNSLIGSMPVVSITIGLWKMKDKNISLLETRIRHIKPLTGIITEAIIIKQPFNIWTCKGEAWGGKWGGTVEVPVTVFHETGDFTGQWWALSLVAVAMCWPRW